MVRSILDEVEAHFRTYSGVGYATEYTQYLSSSIIGLCEDESRPQEHRVSLLSDDEIAALVNKLESARREIERREQAVPAAINLIMRARGLLRRG